MSADSIMTAGLEQFDGPRKRSHEIDQQVGMVLVPSELLRYRGFPDPMGALDERCV